MLRKTSPITEPNKVYRLLPLPKKMLKAYHSKSHTRRLLNSPPVITRSQLLMCFGTQSDLSIRRALLSRGI